MADSVVDSILAARYYRVGEKSFEDVCRRVANALGETPEETKEYFEAMMKSSISQAAVPATTSPTSDQRDPLSAQQTELHPALCRLCVSLTRQQMLSATDVIKQGGRRRGANMGILNVWHKDIMKFIKSKAKEGDFSNFNISVMVNDEFMKAVASGDLDREWLKTTDGETVTVREIWDGIVEGVWKNGEPGILFYDTINRKNPTPQLGDIDTTNPCGEQPLTPQLGDIDTTNPCGEQPLLPFESCVLGSINLAKFIRADGVNYDALDKMTRMAVRFLDAVITKNVFPIEQIQIKEATNRTRKVGLGLMGVHDAMLMLRIPYDSEAGRNFCEEVMARINDVATEESERLGKEKGTFPAYEGSVWDKQGKIMRNAALTTIAPTGTISLLAGCSSGIEPVFSYAYTRRNTVGKTFIMVHPYFESELRRVIAGLGFTGKEAEAKRDEVISHVHETGTVQDVLWLPDAFRAVFKTALDIQWKDHVLMQAVFQKHVHASILQQRNRWPMQFCSPGRKASKA